MISSQWQISHVKQKYNKKMIDKKYLLLLSLITLFSLTNCHVVRQVSSQEELSKLIQQSNNKIWISYEGRTYLTNMTEQSSDAIQKVAQVFKGMIRVAVVKGQSNIQRLRLYQDDRENPQTYTGDYNVDSIVTFVLQNIDEVINARSEVAKALKADQEFQQGETERAKKQWEGEQQLRKKSDTILLSATNWNTFVNDRQAWVINFYEANCSACIELNKQWQLISTAYKGKVKMAKINMTQSENQVLEEQVQLSKYPSVRFYKSGPKKVSEFAEFQGVHKRFSIQEWLNSKLEEKTTQVDIPRLNKENFETLCKSTKNTCIIVFLQKEDSSTLSKIQQLSVKHLKKPITFLISKKGQQPNFAEQVEVSSYPDTVMIYCKQKKLWRMGGLDLQQINDAIGEISLGNRNNFVKYTFGEASLK